MDGTDGDVYFVERNAAVNDHRVVRPAAVVSSSRAPAYVSPAATGTRVTWGGPATVGNPFVQQFAPQGFFSGNQPVYMQPPPWGWNGSPGTLGGLFAGLNGVNLGTLIELAGEAFAAFRSLPTAPTASGDSGTDVANLILYQQALADHEQTTFQVSIGARALGKLLGA